MKDLECGGKATAFPRAVTLLVVEGEPFAEGEKVTS